MSDENVAEAITAVDPTAVIADSAKVTDQTFHTLREWLNMLIAEHGADILVTGAAIVVIQIVRGLLTRYVRSLTGLRQDARRALIVRLRGISIVLTMMVILAIWSSEVRTLTISILALGTISVLAFKELLQCLLGSMVRSGSSSFKVGDRISVDGIRGEVIDISWMHTTVLATGSHLHAITGERVTIPNSVFLTKPIHNYSLGNGYGIQSLDFPVKLSYPIESIKSALVAQATELCSDYIDDVRASVQATYEQKGLTPLAPEPRVRVTIDSADAATITLRMALPQDRKSGIEQALVTTYMLMVAECADGDVATNAESLDNQDKTAEDRSDEEAVAAQIR